jgi:hypothetical protein
MEKRIKKAARIAFRALGVSQMGVRWGADAILQVTPRSAAGF